MIQIKTGSDYNADTYDSVYVKLHGEKYSTELLHVRGSYDRDGLDEQTIIALDVTPVS